MGGGQRPLNHQAAVKEKTSQSRGFFIRADRLCREGAVLADQLDIVHGVADDNLQCFTDDVRGDHVIGGFQRLNQP